MHKRRIYRGGRTGGLRCHVPARLGRLGLLCGFCPSPRTSCTRASSKQTLAGLPLPSARGYPRLQACLQVGTPTGDFHPISSRPCWVHTVRCTGRPITLRVPGFPALRSGASELISLGITTINHISTMSIFSILQTITALLPKTDSVALNTKKINTASEWFKSGKLVFVLGAGASASYGLPDWDTLLKKLLLITITKDEKNKDVEANDATSQKQRNEQSSLGKEASDSSLLAQTFSTVFEPNSLISARYLGQHFRDVYPNDSLAFEKAIRHTLYEDVSSEDSSDLLKEIRQYCIAPGKSPNIDCIITYNYDDLLEKCIKELGLDIPYSTIHARGMHPNTNELPIYHVHGFLPRDGNLTEKNKVVLSEDIYHKQYSDTYGWSNLIQINKFKDFNCLFIGLSFSDPNLRRLLDISKNERGDSSIHHYCFKKHYSSNVVESKIENLKETKYGDIQQMMTNLNIDKTVLAKDLVKLMEKFEEADAKSFGIGVIWINDYSQIPTILKKIRTQ